MLGWSSQLFNEQNQFISDVDANVLKGRAKELFVKVFIKLTFIALLLLVIYSSLTMYFSYQQAIITQQKKLQGIGEKFTNKLDTIKFFLEEETNKFSTLTFNGLEQKERSFSLSELVSPYVQMVSYIDIATNLTDEFMRTSGSNKFRYTLTQSSEPHSKLSDHFQIEQSYNVVFGLLTEPRVGQEVSFYAAAPMRFGDDVVAVIMLVFDSSIFDLNGPNELENQPRVLFANGQELNGDDSLISMQSHSWRDLGKEMFLKPNESSISQPVSTLVYNVVHQPGLKDPADNLRFSLIKNVSPLGVFKENLFKFIGGLVFFVFFTVLNVALAALYADSRLKAWINRRESAVRALAFDCCEGLIIRDHHGVVVNLNQGVLGMTGYQKQQVIGTNISLLDLDQTLQSRFLSILRDAQKEGSWKGEVVVYGPEHSQTTQLLTVGVSFDDKGKVSYYVESYADLSKIKRQEMELRIAAVAFDTQNSLVITDAEGNIQRVNKAFVMMTGYEESEVSGLKPSVIGSGRHDQQFYKKMWHSLILEGNWRGLVWNRRKNGSVYLEYKVITAVKDDEGNTTHYVSNGMDYTLQNELEQKLELMSKTDALTELFNRRCFDEKLKEHIQVFKRYGQTFSIMIIDLDHFKRINDKHGHDVGDKTLKRIAKQCTEIIRDTDIAFRWGGEEFVILLPETEKEGAALMGERVRKLIELNASEPRVTCSIGVTTIQLHDNSDSIVKRADDALYTAKEDRNRVVVLN